MSDYEGGESYRDWEQHYRYQLAREQAENAERDENDGIAAKRRREPAYADD